MALMQQGSAGPLRDLDYINPRPKCPSSALPPEVRKRLGLGPAPSIARSSSCPPENGEHKPLYTGAANAAPKVGASGAGTDWHNPNGHAFVRRGSGLPMSQRASRKAQLEGLRRCTMEPVQRVQSLDRGARLERVADDGGSNGGSNGSRPESRESQQGRGRTGSHRAPSRERRRVNLQLPPKVPTKTRSLTSDSNP
eukprot:SRR837773.3310.p1 GENE.SRR837773.3310~~SRR837773.3310.p1  ORF type:complete len:219 (+),score=49.27 SRR837773.3310:71-658(+)